MSGDDDDDDDDDDEDDDDDDDDDGQNLDFRWTLIGRYTTILGDQSDFRNRIWRCLALISEL